MVRKSVIVTGASEDGIGGEIARKFAREGYNVGITYYSKDKRNLVEELKGLGVDVLCLKMDAKNFDNVKNAFDEFFNYFGRIDSIICNAGVCEREGMLIDMPVSEIDRVIDTNLKGTLFCNKVGISRFLGQKFGNIVNIASILGEKGCSCESVYSASKAGIINLTKSLAQEVGGMGIRVNCVAPGFIDTAMVAEFIGEDRENIINKTPLGRVGKPVDVANGVYFLASDDSSFITGEVLTISGGWTAN